MASEIPDKLTPVSVDEAAAALAVGYRRVTGKSPSAAILSLLLAQWALETGRGEFCHNYNFGNVKHSSADQYYQTFRAGENINGQSIESDMQFAAYLNIDDGAEAYVRQLQKRPNWWAGLQTGDVAKFNAGLSSSPAYYTADPSTYLATLQKLVGEFSVTAKKYASGIWYRIGQALFLVALAASGVYVYKQVRR